jgi:NADH-quinone oxidoreductase subunit M
MNLISSLILLPLIAALLIALAPERLTRAIRLTAILATFADLALSIVLFANFRAGTADMQFVERVGWIGQLGISYYVGVDGLSILLVMLTTFLMVIAIGGSWAGISERVKEITFSFSFSNPR